MGARLGQGRIAALEPHRRAALAGHLAMAGFSALVAGSFSLGVTIANDISPMALTAPRCLIAGALMTAMAFAFGPGIRRRDVVAPWRYLVLGGLYAAYFVLMFEGLKTAAPVPASAVFTLTPAMAALFGWWLLAQVTTPRMALALAIGGAGALWVIFRGDPAALFAFDIGRGEAIYFWGCVAHAALAPMIRRLNRGEAATVTTALMMGGAVVLLGVAGAGEIAATDWAGLPARVWWVMLYLAVFATAGSFFLLQYASMRLPSAKVMAYTYLTPSWVIGWEVALGRPAPPGLVAVGVALTALALLILLRDDERAR
ncbi:MAG: DMT family transporter [Gemmobacter sp.]|jgi:drug/metabolite transporter (DMT)-like permease